MQADSAAADFAVRALFCRRVKQFAPVEPLVHFQFYRIEPELAFIFAARRGTLCVPNAIPTSCGFAQVRKVGRPFAWRGSSRRLSHRMSNAAPNKARKRPSVGSAHSRGSSAGETATRNSTIRRQLSCAMAQ